MMIRFAILLAVVTGLTAPQVAPDPLLDAVGRGDLATVRSLLLNRKDPNTSDADGLSALHAAARAGHVEIAKLLIDAGARVEATTRLGACTPLHLAAGAARADMVNLLLFARADPNAATTPGRVTPLHLAARASNGAGVVRELLRRGASVDVREAGSGQTPLMLADAAGQAATVRALLDGGADQTLRGGAPAATQAPNVLESCAA